MVEFGKSVLENTFFFLQNQLTDDSALSFSHFDCYAVCIEVLHCYLSISLLYYLLLAR